jgi:sec-independent protein translocase protein TatC
VKPYHRLIAFVQEIRRHLLFLGAAVIGGTILFYLISPQLFAAVQKHLNQPLVFYTVAEPFLAHVQLALSVNVFVLVPLFAVILWRSLAKPFQLSTKHIINFTLFTCLLFYCGAGFCYFITLPFGVDFLLSFGSEQLKPVISVSKFVTFVTVFVLAFGLIFELPICMVFLTKTGVATRQTFEKGRRYAILIISIVAALLTPTPDIVNMMLMGGPLYLLYELGIIIIKLLKPETVLPEKDQY